jgi:type III pantothenate kinase
MTLLAIDSGNSRIKWGLYQNGGWMTRDVVPVAYASDLSARWSGLAKPDRIVIAHVGRATTASNIAGVLECFDVQPNWIVSRHEQCGVRSSYAEPAQLGPDRWAALIGARHLYDGPAVVVNAGTTLTVDALSAEGIFLGGLIIPGYTLMRQSLSGGTERLALQDGRFNFFPDNTGDAISSGACNALAGAIDRMVRYMREASGGDATILLSGGDASVIAPLLNGAQVVDNLVLEGMVCIGNENG